MGAWTPSVEDVCIDARWSLAIGRFLRRLEREMAGESSPMDGFGGSPSARALVCLLLDVLFPVAQKRRDRVWKPVRTLCDESRRYRTWSAAFSFARHFWRLEWESASSAGFRKRVPGLPTHSSCRPHLEVGASAVAIRTRLEAALG